MKATHVGVAKLGSWTRAAMKATHVGVAKVTGGPSTLS